MSVRQLWDGWKRSRICRAEDPVLVTADIKKKEETLSRVADPILTKPPPKPKVIATASSLWSHVCKSTKPVIGCL